MGGYLDAVARKYGQAVVFDYATRTPTRLRPSSPSPLPNYDGYKPHTLCELCSKACGHCRWSRKDVQLPVPGWTAIRRDIIGTGEPGSNVVLESYVVLECPQFEADQRCERYLPFDAKAAAASAERWGKESNIERD